MAGSENTQRHHIIDACQLLNKARTFKYTGASLGTLNQAIALCRNKAIARQQIYRRLIINALIGNSDNHLKNISFLVDASGVNIADMVQRLA